MASLDAIVDYLDRELRTREVPDYQGALNGLQAQNNGTVSHVAAAVDCSTVAVRAAAELGADLLLVHHGMFWWGGGLSAGRGGGGGGATGHREEHRRLQLAHSSRSPSHMGKQCAPGKSAW